MSGHVSPIKLYIGIFLTLMVLTAITIMVAYVNLGPWNKVVALGIASFKATLVVLYFMHVKYASRMTKLIVVTGFFFLAILLGRDDGRLQLAHLGQPSSAAAIAEAIRRSVSAHFATSSAPRTPRRLWP